MMKRFLLLSALGVAPAMAQNSPYIEAVDEYVPAPGQFVNVLPAYEVGDDATSMAAKCTEAIAHNAGGLITLGGWGGYVTFHFDHPVVNVPGQKDIYIAGNAIEGNSEAGIVMVSRDSNHNGLPDDPWYELSGSVDEGAQIEPSGSVDEGHEPSGSVDEGPWYDYEITYRCEDVMADIPWTDNYQNRGVIPRNTFHKQAYFPLWLAEQGSLCFSGTRLPDNASDTGGNGSYWVLNAFAYGYVDNRPNSEREANSFDISRAVEPGARTPVHLPSIDFVRVYTGLNQVAGWLGETSTEIAGAEDLHPDAETAIRSILQEDEPKWIIMGNLRLIIKNYKLTINNNN